MSQFFAYNYTGPAFQLFGPAHLTALALIILANLLLIQFKRASDSTRRIVRYCLAGILWAAEISWHAWNIWAGAWSVQFMLPLNLCSLLIWLTGFMLVFKERHIYQFAYFLGIGTATQYLLTPDLGIYGFPTFRFIQTFISHGLLVTCAIYMTVAEGFRPTWKSLWQVVLWTNAYMVGIFILNSAIGADYLLLNGKPSTPSLLDMLPAWPYYIPYMEVIGVAIFLLLYLPFFLRDRKTVPTAAAA